METWIDDSIKTLKTQYKLCEQNNEKALALYISCYIKILNGMIELETTDFHYYERRILWFPMKLFAKYFIEQINSAFSNNDISNKNMVIEDLEIALANIAEVYRNVVDGTVNSDRKMIATLGIDTNLYELSPKLCSFYSVMLAEMVKTFDSKGADRKYAFFLYPTFRRNTEMTLLFEQRKKSGKIAVVNISNNFIEQYKILPIILGHEMFHVLLREERLPQNRAKNLYCLMHIYAKGALFSGVKFDDSNENDTKIKQKLFNTWFKKAPEEANFINTAKENDRTLYSTAISKKCVKYLNESLIGIIGTLETDLKEALYEQKEIHDYLAYEELNGKIRNYIEHISRNIYTIIAKREMAIFCNFMINIFREVYADIACLLTLEISSEKYQDAFYKSEFFNYEKNYNDYLKWIRISYVSNTLADNTEYSIKESWKNLYRFARKKIKNIRNDKNLSCKNGTNYGIITDRMDEFFTSYFANCAKKIKLLVATKRNEVNLIRSAINKVLIAEQSAFLSDVLSGAAEYKYFSEIKHKNGGNEIENSN